MIKLEMVERVTFADPGCAGTRRGLTSNHLLGSTNGRRTYSSACPNHSHPLRACWRWEGRLAAQIVFNGRLTRAMQSTFAASLVAYQPTKWVTCCQDELKTRSRVEARVREALDNGFSPIVDRTNITAECANSCFQADQSLTKPTQSSQRATWVEIANEFEVPAYLLFRACDFTLRS